MVATTHDVVATRASTGKVPATEGEPIETTARPARRPELICAVVRERHVVFDPRDRQLYELREDAASLLPTLDGTATFATLVLELADAGDLDRHEAERLLRTILDPLIAAGLVVADAHSSEESTP